MSNGNAITARLGIDAGPMRKGLNDATKELTSANARMAASNKSRGESAEGVWEREKKVERQTEALAAKLVNCQTAGDAMSASLDTLFNTLNLGIASGAMAALGVGLFDQLMAARAEAEKFNAAIAAIGSDTSGMGSRGLAAYEERIVKIQEAMKEASKEKGWFKSAIDFASSSHLLGGKGYDAKIEERDAQMAGLQQELEKARTNIAAIEDKKRAEAEAKLDAELAESRKKDLQKTVEDGNKLYLKSIEEKKKADEDRAKAERDLDEKLAEAKRKDLQKTIEDGNKLYLEAEEKKRAKAKQKEEQEQDRRVEAAASKAEKMAARESAAREKFIDDKLAGPEAARAAARAQRKRDSLASRYEREADLGRRGGRSRADVEADAERNLPLSERVARKSQVGPKEPLLEREARLRRQRADDARKGLSKGRQDDEATKLKEALDGSAMGKAILSIEKKLGVNTK